MKYGINLNTSKDKSTQNKSNDLKKCKVYTTYLPKNGMIPLVPCVSVVSLKQ